MALKNAQITQKTGWIHLFTASNAMGMASWAQLNKLGATVSVDLSGWCLAVRLCSRSDLFEPDGMQFWRFYTTKIMAQEMIQSLSQVAASGSTVPYPYPNLLDPGFGCFAPAPWCRHHCFHSQASQALWSWSQLGSLCVKQASSFQGQQDHFQTVKMSMSRAKRPLEPGCLEPGRSRAR